MLTQCLQWTEFEAQLEVGRPLSMSSSMDTNVLAVAGGVDSRQKRRVSVELFNSELGMWEKVRFYFGNSTSNSFVAQGPDMLSRRSSGSIASLTSTHGHALSPDMFF